jgi:hypothetical protein
VVAVCVPLTVWAESVVGRQCASAWPLERLFCTLAFLCDELSAVKEEKRAGNAVPYRSRVWTEGRVVHTVLVGQKANRRIL